MGGSFKLMKYSVHGKRRAAERGISEKAILQAIIKPSYSFYDLSSAAYVVFQKLDGQYLLVVYTDDNGEFKIITTFITSSAQEIINSKLKTSIWVEMK